MKIDATMVNAIGYGGQNADAIFRRYGSRSDSVTKPVWATWRYRPYRFVWDGYSISP
jgi:hypothetical protein